MGNITPFTIQLLYGSSGYKQPVNLGVHKLKNHEISSVEHQHGDAKGFYNVKSAVLSCDNYTCQICGAKHPKLEVHHIRLRSEDGSNRMDNLVALCKDCNAKVHTG